MAQVLVQGISTGLIYALVGIGFVVVFRTVGVFNFAHAESYTIGALATYTLTSQFGLPYWLSIILAGVVALGVGLITERIAFRRLLIENAPPVNIIVASIALGVILRAGALLVWGPDSRRVEGIGLRITTPNVVLGGQNLLILLAVVLVIVALWLLLFRTRLGVALRAVADNRITASLLGVDSRLTFPTTFGLAGFLGGVAGALIAPLIFPHFLMGQDVLIKAFAAGIIGGLDSIPGAIVGGLFIGIIELFAGSYISSAYKNVLVFALLIVVLVIRPAGILGKDRVEKV